MFKNKKFIIIILVIAAVGILAYFMLGSDDSNTPSKITKPNTKPSKITKPNTTPTQPINQKNGDFENERLVKAKNNEMLRAKLVELGIDYDFIYDIVKLYNYRRDNGTAKKYLSLYYLAHQVKEDRLKNLTSVCDNAEVINTVNNQYNLLIDFLIANNYTIQNGGF